jgi:L-ascorbate metabolism protein UlaG (beta-lactamase superfamily)
MVTTTHLALPSTAAEAYAEQGSIFFIGNATVLIRVAGFTILTDPTFIHKHEQTWLGYGLYTTRLVDPAIDIGDLPPLDLVLLSHFHGDHFDHVAERDLDRTLPIVTTPQSAKELEQRGFSHCIPLETWSSLDVEKGGARLRITATPAQHGPPIVDFALPDVLGSVLDVATPEGRAMRLYITGDTLIIDDLKEIPRRFPDIDIALLHLGGTRVLGILVSMDAEQGVEMLRIVDPALVIPIHYADYDVFTSPLSDYQAAVRAAGLADRVHYLRHGDTYTFG